jgi:hypothetical protein
MADKDKLISTVKNRIMGRAADALPDTVGAAPPWIVQRGSTSH